MKYFLHTMGKLGQNIISVLVVCMYIYRYVVDLVRFRRIAAGDRLRGQYQALSQDPNSLSNLDQVYMT